MRKSAAQIARTGALLVLFANSQASCAEPEQRSLRTGTQGSTQFTIELPAQKTEKTTEKDPEKSARKLFEQRTDRSSVPAASLRTMTARISGSLCAVCLRTLARKLETTRGVVEVRIDRPEKLNAKSRLPDEVADREPRFAPAAITYDCRQIDLEELKRIIKSHDVFAWQVVDRSSEEISKGKPLVK